MARWLPPTPQAIHPTTTQAPANPKTVTPTVHPAPSTGRRRISEAEYWEKYYVDLDDHQYEWNNGSLEEKPMTDYVSYTRYNWLVTLLKEYLTVRPLAKIIGLEMGCRLALPHQVAIRKPDLGLVLNSNPVPLGPFDQSYCFSFPRSAWECRWDAPRPLPRRRASRRHSHAERGNEKYVINLVNTLRVVMPFERSASDELMTQFVQEDIEWGWSGDD